MVLKIPEMGGKTETGIKVKEERPTMSSVLQKMAQMFGQEIRVPKS